MKILDIGENPSVLDVIYSVTEFYCKRHFSATARDNVRARIFCNIYCEGSFQHYAVFRNIFIPSVHFVSNLLFYSSRLNKHVVS
jgi:hypothetical protein